MWASRANADDHDVKCDKCCYDIEAKRAEGQAYEIQCEEAKSPMICHKPNDDGSYNDYYKESVRNDPSKKDM